jgi:hypothetical protein
MERFFYGSATGTQYTHDGNGCAYHGRAFGIREGYLVHAELCGHLVATVYAVADDFGNLVPVRVRANALLEAA